MGVPSPEDGRLLRFLLDNGLVTREQWEECVSQRKKQIDLGKTVPDLPDILVRKGYLTPEQMRQATARPAAEKPATAFGRYRIVRELGRGAMGVVYEAHDPKLGRTVALKKMLRDAYWYPDEAKRFAREARAAARLRHPHVVAIHEVGSVEGVPFFTMDFVKGTTLAEHLKSRDSTRRKAGSSRLREEVSILAKVADAVATAHREGIVHRDLKPGNILLDARDEPFVMDFGLAKEMDKETAKLTVSGQPVGTPRYMSPEQTQGQTVTPASDVWALGAVLYEMLARRPPFDASSVVGLYFQIQRQDPEPPHKRVPRLPRDLETICLKCLEKQPERRYGNAGEVAEELGRWLRGEPIRAHPPSATYRFRRFVGRNRTILIPTAAAALLALVLAAWVGGNAMRRGTRVRQGLEEGARHEREGDSDKARDAYRGVLDLVPDHVAAQEGFQRTDEEVKRRAAQREEARAKAEREREHAEKKRQSSEVYQQAMRELHALRLRSYRADWRLTDEEFKKYEKLIDGCRKEMERTGPSAEGWWVIGRARHVLGNWTAALDAYGAGLAARPQDGACLLYKARVLIEQALIHRFTRWRSAGDEKNADGGKADAEIKEAVELVGRGVASGELTAIELDLAKGYELVVKGESAEGYCAEMLKKWKGGDFWEEFYLVRGLAVAGQIIEDAGEALRIRPAFAEALFWRGVGRYATGDSSGAIGDYTKAVEINPRYAHAYYCRAIARATKSDLDGAIADYTKAVEINPRYADAYCSRGVARHTRGDLAGAIEDWTKGIEIRPWDPETYYRRGNARYEKGDPDGAIEDYTQAIRINPRHARVYNNRGIARHDKGDPAGAIEDYAKAIEFDPHDEAAYVNRGAARFDRGDLAGAIEDFTKATEISPRNAWAYYARGGARRALAAREPARARELLRAVAADLEKALEVAPADWQFRSRVEAALREARVSLAKLK
ncbi:MAG: tetratricopeptide repeat protein [Planctomycetes bacterium]|nr:tetratricopeptide repeat protein [Planctomycetota bacterium]